MLVEVISINKTKTYKINHSKAEASYIKSAVDSSDSYDPHRTNGWMTSTHRLHILGIAETLVGVAHGDCQHASHLLASLVFREG